MELIIDFDKPVMDKQWFMVHLLWFTCNEYQLHIIIHHLQCAADARLCINQLSSLLSA